MTTHSKECPRCESTQRPAAIFCDQCNNPLDGSTAPQSRPEPSSQINQTTNGDGSNYHAEHDITVNQPASTDQRISTGHYVEVGPAFKALTLPVSYGLTALGAALCFVPYWITGHTNLWLLGIGLIVATVGGVNAWIRLATASGDPVVPRLLLPPLQLDKNTGEIHSVTLTVDCPWCLPGTGSVMSLGRNQDGSLVGVCGRNQRQHRLGLDLTQFGEIGALPTGNPNPPIAVY